MANNEFTIGNDNPIACTFTVNAVNTNWGKILGNIQDQTDLIDLVDSATGAIQGEVEEISANLSALGQTVSDNYITLDNKIDDTKTELANDISDLASTVSDNYNTLDGKIDANTSLINVLDATLSALGETVSANYITLNGKIGDNTMAINNHIADKTNPHEVTKSQVGLSNVDNTSDLNKPISTATQTALDGKIDKLSTKPTAGTYTKVTISNEGLVTSGTTLQASDIPSLTLSKISDVTATASEVNILDGATLTTTELNYVDGVTSPIQTQINSNATNISNIQDLIPNQASVSNQLADKQFVNSAIQTNSAHFRGNWATWADVPTDVNDYPADDDGNKTPTTNDYMVVQNASDYTGDTLEGAWQFTYTGLWATNGKSGWQPRFQVNESPLTPAQQTALDSGITPALVAQISTNTNDISTINTTIGGYGNIVTYNASSFATSSQGAKADTAVQPTAIANMQTTTNLVTSVSGSSTDSQYPSAKLFYDTVGNLETLLHTINSGNN